MEWWQILLAVIGLLGSAGFSSVVTSTITSRRERAKISSDASVRGAQITTEHYSDLLNRYRAEITELKQHKAEFDAYKIKTEAELERLRVKITLLETAHYDLPIPMWLKDTRGVVLSVNEAFEREVLIPVGARKEDYLGTTDEEFWVKFLGPKHGAIFAGRFRSTDEWVMRTGEIYDGPESKGLPGDKIDVLRVIKYPRYAGGVKIGVGGIALPGHIGGNDKDHIIKEADSVPAV